MRARSRSLCGSMLFFPCGEVESELVLGEHTPWATPMAITRGRPTSKELSSAESAVRREPDRAGFLQRTKSPRVARYMSANGNFGVRSARSSPLASW